MMFMMYVEAAQKLSNSFSATGKSYTKFFEDLESRSLQCIYHTYINTNIRIYIRKYVYTYIYTLWSITLQKEG